MYAKLVFSSAVTTADIRHAVVQMLTDQPISSITAPTFLAQNSYVLTTRSAAGWRKDYDADGDYVVSATCLDSAKRKYIRFLNATTFRYALGDSVLPDGNLGNATATQIPVIGTGFREVHISASPRHFCMNSFSPGTFNSGTSTKGNMAMVFEHRRTDSWMVEDTSYLPACIFDSTSVTTSNMSAVRFLGLKHKNIASPINADTANAQLFPYTKYGHTSMNDCTVTSTNLAMNDKGEPQRVLLPFGVRNNTNLVRGGSVSDLCDVYFAQKDGYPDGFAFAAGDAMAHDYVALYMGFGGHTIAVPRG